MTKLLSVIKGENCDVWKTILFHYINVIRKSLKVKTVKVLDLTAGEKRMWKGIDYTSKTLEGEKIMDVTFMDIKGGKDIIKADYRKLPFRSWSFHLAVWDPPYAEALGFHFRPLDGTEFGTKFTRIYNLEYGILQESDIKPVMNEAFRVLTDGGYFIVKIQDTVHEWHYKIYSEAKSFKYLKYIGVVIQHLPSTWHIYIDDEDDYKPQTIHTYWMIFKK